MDYETLKDTTTVAKTVEALKGRNITGIPVANGAEALAKIKEMIPKGASVMNGASATLEQIGYVDYLKSGQHGWDNPHERILAEKDPAKQSRLRKEALLSDYYLGSVHALAETGEYVVASNSGSQLPHHVFTSPDLILVVSTKKIMPTLAGAMDRLNTHVIPQEDARMQKVYGMGTFPSKILISNRESPFLGRKVTILLVNENLGF